MSLKITRFHGHKHGALKLLNYYLLRTLSVYFQFVLNTIVKIQYFYNSNNGCNLENVYI